MTYSQKVARVFEVADYFLLFPAVIGVIAATDFIIRKPLPSLVIYGVILIGLILMVGYFKHSRGRLSNKWVLRLWIGSAVFNFGLLMPLIYILYSEVGRVATDSGYQVRWENVLKYFIIGFGYIVAVFVSIKSYASAKNQKYR